MRLRRLLLLAATAGLVIGAGGVRAEWVDDHKVMRVGFLTTSGASYDSARLEPFRAYLESWLAMPVELVPAATYAALIDAQTTDRVQYAIHTATSYATAAASCQCIEPVAMPTAFDAAHGYHAILAARADGPIAAIADAAGKRLAVTSEDSIAGRLVPLTFLARDGIDVATHFAAIVEAADPATAVTALFTNEADVAVAWSSLTGEAAIGYNFGVLTRMVAEGRLSMDMIRVVWTSPLIPFGPHAVRVDVPAGLKTRLVGALTAMAATAPDALDAVDRSSIGGGGFVAVTAADYEVIDALLGGDAAATTGSTVSPAAGASPPPD